MSNRADDQSRVLGGFVVLGAVLAGTLFLAGLAVQSYWAIAIPVAIAFLFVLGLVIWIGWTIATVQTEASGDPLPVQGGPGSATQEASPEHGPSPSAPDDGAAQQSQP